MKQAVVKQHASQLLEDAVTTVQSVDDGSNSVYVVSTADEQYVVKFGTVTDMASFRAEPLVQTFVNNTTSVPVPRVVKKAMANDPPMFLMEYVDGTRPGKTVPFDLMETFVYDAGETLAKLHTTTLDVEYAGELHAKQGSQTWYVEADETWQEQLERTVGEVLQDAEPQFADTAAQIRTVYDSYASRIPRLDEYSLIHGDYRFDNLIMGNDGSVRSVLDWGQALAGDPLYNTARTVYLIGRDYAMSPNRARTLVQAFFNGYTNVRPLQLSNRRDAWELYLLHTIAVELRWFSTWYADWESPRRTKWAARIRQRVQTAAQQLDMTV